MSDETKPFADVVDRPAAEIMTLDEPIFRTIWRDLREILLKLLQVLLPFRQWANLRDWDLWGPLFICLTLAALLSATAPANQSSLVFAIVFVFVWIGAIVVALNAVLLGGKVSFFQAVCVMGYSIFPLALMSIILLCLGTSIRSKIWVRVVCIIPACVWSLWASFALTRNAVPPKRKILAVYPLFLFFLVLSWMVVIQPY